MRAFIIVAFYAETNRDMDVFQQWLDDCDFSVKKYAQDDIAIWVIRRKKVQRDPSKPITMDDVKFMLKDADECHKDLHRIIETITEVKVTISSDQDPR